MMREVQLNVPERLHLLPLIPIEGSYVTLRIGRELGLKVGISADEYKEYEIKEFVAKNEEGKEVPRVSWNDKGGEPKPFKFKEKEFELFAKALEELDKNGKLTQQQYSLYEKFVKEQEDEEDAND